MFDLEPVRVAGLGEQLTSTVRVVTELLVQRRVEAGGGLGEQLGGRPGTRVQVVHDRLAVGRVEQRQPRLLAGERRVRDARLVPDREADDRAADGHRLLAGLDQLDGGGVEDGRHVGLAGDDGIGQGLRVGDHPEDDGVVRPFVGVPRLGVLVERVGARLRGVALVEGVRAGAVRRGLQAVGVRDALGADDHAGGVDEVGVRRRLRRGPGDDDGLLVLRRHVGDLRRLARRESAVALEQFVAATVQVGLDQLGVQRRAVGEGHTVAQGQRGLGVLRIVLELGHQARLDRTVRLGDEQRVVHRAHERELALRVQQRVVAARGGVGVEGDRDGVLGALAAAATTATPTTAARGQGRGAGHGDDGRAGADDCRTGHGHAPTGDGGIGGVAACATRA